MLWLLHGSLLVLSGLLLARNQVPALKVADVHEQGRRTGTSIRRPYHASFNP
jgi:hypothetical protein